MSATPTITTVGVVGAGTMGSAIAQHFAMKGLTVRLVDLKQESVDRGLAGIRTSLRSGKMVAISRRNDSVKARLAQIESAKRIPPRST